MRKYTRTENVEVLSPEQHEAIADELHRIGKTSAQELSEEERQDLADTIQTTEE